MNEGGKNRDFDDCNKLGKGLTMYFHDPALLTNWRTTNIRISDQSSQ